jgi:hypothetical protein
MPAAVCRGTSFGLAALGHAAPGRNSLVLTGGRVAGFAGGQRRGVVASRPWSQSREHSAALAGEPQHDQWHADGRFGMYSLLMNPAVAWQPEIGSSHPCYEWAEDHHAPHFAGVPGADQRYHALLREFRKQTGPLTGASLAAACRRAPGWPLGHA